MRTDRHPEPKMVSHNQEWKTVSQETNESWIRANGPGPEGIRQQVHQKTKGALVTKLSSSRALLYETGLLLTLRP